MHKVFYKTLLLSVTSLLGKMAAADLLPAMFVINLSHIIFHPLRRFDFPL